MRFNQGSLPEVTFAAPVHFGIDFPSPMAQTLFVNMQRANHDTDRR
jgi:hypothetical protein